MLSVLVILAMLFSFANVAPAAAQDEAPPNPPGWTQGSGIHFALPNSPYLPVTLDSSFPVTLTLSSVPEVVDLTIAANPAAGSAEFTLSGFAANTLYYRYADNGLDPDAFTTDDTGSFTYTQDLSEPHHVWFRDQPSTYYLYDNATGGDCTAFGTWDVPTKTCTLTADVYQTIWFQGDGITLDGDGFSSLYSDNYYAVYSCGYSDVTIKNLNVSGSSYGIYLCSGNNITVTNNSVSGSSYYGVVASGISNLTVTNNTTSVSYYGIIVQQANNFAVTDNTINNSYYYGIYLWDANNGTIRGNTISNVSYDGGVYIDGYSYSYDQWYNGTNYVGSYDYSSSNNTVYQNSFVNTSTPIVIANWASPAYTTYWDSSYYCGYPCYGSYTYDTTGNVGNVFNLAAPDGGNYYSQYDESAEGCDNTNSDSFCDSAFIGSGGAVDNLPWTTQDGWATPPDTTAPTASPTQSPAANGAGWNNSDVTVTWNWSDEAGGSGIDNTNCTIDNTSTGEGNPITLNATCKDLAGNEGNASYAVMVDKTKPTISATATTSPNGAGWYNADVTVQFTCTDALSGIPSGSCPADQVLSTEGVAVSSSAQTVTDAAGNTSDASNVVTVQIDKTKPTLNPVVNPNPVLLNGVATVTSGAADALSGLASQSCGALDTSTVGPKLVTCTATDNAGNTNSADASYSVIFNWAGFFQPVDNLPTWNSVKAGQAIPVKFSLGGDHGLNIFMAGYPKSEQITCNSNALVDGIEETVTAGSSSLTYDPGSDRYHYVWKTQKSWAGTCRQLVLKLVDGTTQRANFQFK